MENVNRSVQVGWSFQLNVFQVRLTLNFIFLSFTRLISWDGETSGGGAGRPDSHSGPGTWPAHLPEQRGPRYPRRLGGSLAPRPAALPASQWPPAQPPAQRQHAQLPERWVTRLQPVESLGGTSSPRRVTL